MAARHTRFITTLASQCGANCEHAGDAVDPAGASMMSCESIVGVLDNLFGDGISDTEGTKIALGLTHMAMVERIHAAEASPLATKTTKSRTLAVAAGYSFVIYAMKRRCKDCDGVFIVLQTDSPTAMLNMCAHVVCHQRRLAFDVPNGVLAEMLAPIPVATDKAAATHKTQPSLVNALAMYDYPHGGSDAASSAEEPFPPSTVSAEKIESLTRLLQLQLPKYAKAKWASIAVVKQPLASTYMPGKTVIFLIQKRKCKYCNHYCAQTIALNEATTTTTTPPAEEVTEAATAATTVTPINNGRQEVGRIEDVCVLFSRRCGRLAYNVQRACYSSAKPTGLSAMLCLQVLEQLDPESAGTFNAEAILPLTTATSGPCGSCGQLVTNMCGRCQATFYCSRECQKSHWPSHRRECQVIAAALAHAAATAAAAQ